MGMVAFRSSTSGVNVTSRMGPTMDGMNLILWGPEMKGSEDIITISPEVKYYNFPPYLFLKFFKHEENLKEFW